MFLPRFRYVVIFCFDLGFAKKFTAQSDVALTVSICQQTVIAYFHEPVRQNVEKKPSDELVGFNGHCLHFIVVGVVSPEERHLAILNLEDAVVADGYSVGISAEVLEDPFGAVKGGLTIDNPLLVVEQPPEAFESVTLIEMTDNVGEEEFAGFVTCFQVCPKLLLEQLRHNLYVNEKLFSR